MPLTTAKHLLLLLLELIDNLAGKIFPTVPMISGTLLGSIPKAFFPRSKVCFATSPRSLSIPWPTLSNVFGMNGAACTLCNQLLLINLISACIKNIPRRAGGERNIFYLYLLLFFIFVRSFDSILIVGCKRTNVLLFDKISIWLMHIMKSNERTNEIVVSNEFEASSDSTIS